MSQRLEKYVEELRWATEHLPEEYERGYRHAEDDIKRELLKIIDRDLKGEAP